MATPGEFSIDPELLRAASEAMRRYVDEFNSNVQTLSAKVTGAGSPWGDDEMGSLFGTAYNEATQLGFQALNHVTDLFSGMADALAKVGEVLQAADQGQSQTFDQQPTGSG
jgi:hypothetical protein